MSSLFTHLCREERAGADFPRESQPGKYSYASPGTGTTMPTPSGELFRISLGLDITHVPFNGAAPAITSTIAGHTPIMFGALPVPPPA
jgi:tripartite-type tricarboxylate transporter receptor subunit TctC